MASDDRVAGVNWSGESGTPTVAHRGFHLPEFPGSDTVPRCKRRRSDRRAPNPTALQGRTACTSSS